MKSLGIQLGAMLLAIIIVGGLFALIGWTQVGMDAVWGALAAGVISLPVSAIVVVFFYCRGVQAASIVAGTMLRLISTALLAGAGVLLLPVLRTPSFFLAIGLVYLANLGLETWFAFRSNSVSRRVETPVGH
ncbi:hypothetical protein SH668x_003560 [Planctomicrobium sp. SH668]|uniref:hypothetical protein n=1 Tax=Planctomicrobium sp. SH668 TaxID=3448126 RepID=UPI003F5C237C